jgi:diguanylate cyclase (GGDEF)-like protein
MRNWLCPSELERSRFIDGNDRVRMIRLVGSGAVGAALLITTPWFGWWTLILFGLSTLNFLNLDRRMAKSASPETLSAIAILITMLLLGCGVALSGGPRSPALCWLVLPAGMTAARFRPQVVVAALLLTVIEMLVVTAGVDLTATLRDPVPVVATLALLIGVVSIVWALQAAELHHRGEAILDPLTGLLNRNSLLPRFIELSYQARLTRQYVSLIICDVDNFKSVNDLYGHDRGDAVLRDIAYELRKRLRSFELIYRLGGEEFLILLPGIHHAEGVEIAERLREAIEMAHPTGLQTTLSLGVSSGCGEQVDYDTLFKAADEALYNAKRRGRNCVVAAPPQPAQERSATAASEVARTADLVTGPVLS